MGRAKIAKTILQEAIDANNGHAVVMVIDEWFRIARDPDHDKYLGALKLFTEYAFGKPVQEIEATIRQQTTLTFGPEALKIMGVETMEVHDFNDAGNPRTRTIVAPPSRDSDRLDVLLKGTDIGMDN